MKLLLDEMYPPALAQALRAGAINATTIAELGMAGSSDPDVFVHAVAENYVSLTENVADFDTTASDEREERRRKARTAAGSASAAGRTGDLPRLAARPDPVLRWHCPRPGHCLGCGSTLVPEE